MSLSWRRYEILLPLRFKDGRAVPRDWFDDAVAEIVGRFGGASHETQRVRGRWTKDGVLHHDSMSRIVVDVPDDDANRAWMKTFKERWQARTAEDQIWLTSHPIDVE
ncbi:MAG: hypothetical protein QM811_29535 [Pirellulales bacterium]